jgi:hypothetical protein
MVLVRRAAALSSAALLLACHTITEDVPQTTRGNPTLPGSIPVIVVPVPQVTPVPTPTPVAGNPTPAPNNPTPAPTPRPPSSTCALGRGNGSGANCPYERARFAEDVERAIDIVIRDYPQLFNMRDNRCPQGCPFVRDTDGYWEAVTNEMRRMGYCATHDGEELAVKNSNAFNDQYDIISGDGYIRRGGGAYRSTCYPAWF